MKILGTLLKRTLDEEFVFTHLLFKSLDEAQTELDAHFPGSTIAHRDSIWVIYNAKGVEVARISTKGVAV
jgi:hypothetical protein